MNPDVQLTLKDAVKEVLGLLTGLDLEYSPQLDRFNAVTRQLNRALRSNALEHEWSFYADVEIVGAAVEGEAEIVLDPLVRPRIVSDDAVRLLDADGIPRVWAYFLPRDALHKYRTREGLWCAVLRSTLTFSRPFTSFEDGMDIQASVMREPIMFNLPDQPEDPGLPLEEVDPLILDQPVDFDYPDVVILRAAFYYAQTDPVMQPRVQTLEAQMKDLMYQIIERDDRMTDSPFQNEFTVPILNSVMGPDFTLHGHPHADERR